MNRDVLFERWKGSGDADAFASLVGELRAQLLRHAYRLVHKASPEDVVQIVILELFSANRSTLPSTYDAWAKGIYRRLEWRAADANRQRAEISIEEPVSDDDSLSIGDVVESAAFNPVSWRGEKVEQALAAIEAMSKTCPAISEYLDLLAQGLSKQEVYHILSERHGGHWTTWKGRCLGYDRRISLVASDRVLALTP